jgi:hypothetical protein
MPSDAVVVEDAAGVADHRQMQSAGEPAILGQRGQQLRDRVGVAGEPGAQPLDDRPLGRHRYVEPPLQETVAGRHRSTQAGRAHHAAGSRAAGQRGQRPGQPLPAHPPVATRGAVFQHRPPDAVGGAHRPTSSDTRERTVELIAGPLLTAAPAAVRTLVTLHGGVLFTLGTAPPGEVTPELTRELAASIVRAGLT